MFNIGYPHSRNRSLGIALCALLSSAAQAVEFPWDNSDGDNDFANRSNWVRDSPPIAGNDNFALIDLAGADKCVFSSGTSVNIAGFYIGYEGTDGEFEQTGGSLRATAASSVASRVGRNGESGLWTMSGGEASINAIQLGLSNIAGSRGTMIVTGGNLTILRSSDSRSLSVDTGGADTEGYFEISGGSLQTRVDAFIGDNGTFSVVGSGATNIGIGSFGSGDGQWVQQPGGTLRCRIDETAAGITDIRIADNGHSGDGDGNAVFGNGALLDIGFEGTPVEGSWDMMTWDGILINNGLRLAPGVDPAVWSFDFVDTNRSGTPDTLRVKTAAVAETSDSGVPGAFSAEASDSDYINDGQRTFGSEEQSPVASTGAEGLNDGIASSSGAVNNAYFAPDQFPATVTYTLDTSVNTGGYDITEITTIAGRENGGANLANQVYEVWVSSVGSDEFSLLHTVNYKPFVDGGEGETRVTLNNSSGLLANNIDQVRFVFLDDGEDFGSVDGSVYQEIDIFSTTVTPPALVVSPMFNDSMVLQRDLDVPVWGAAPAGATVTIELDGETVATPIADSSGRWTATIGSYAGDGGQPHTLVFSTPDESSVTFTDVVFGDVYIASGQSNMARTLSGVFATAEIAVAEFPLIRQVTVALVTSPNELEDPEIFQDWMACSPPVAGDFCAVGYYFARELQETTGEPVGLLFSAWGGQPIERFVNPEGMAAVPSLSGILENVEEGEISPYYDIYNSMIAPMSPYGVLGAIWYQGEQNAGAGDGDIYQFKMRALIRGWREKWGQDSLPFYFVQLPNFIVDADWPALREAQRRTLTEPDTGMAVIIDVGDDNDIHPTNKLDPGNRLARLALVSEFGQSGVSTGPLFNSAEVEGGQIRVIFNQTGSGLFVGTKRDDRPVSQTSGALQNFEIAGADKVFVSATALIDGSTVLVSNAAVPSPRFVRYCYSNAPTGGNKLYNAAGIPASPFRSDVDFELEVFSGSGGESGITAGSTLSIVADPAPAGMVFDRWIGAASALGDPNAESTTVVMPDHDIYLTASYRMTGATSYSITVESGDGDGTAQAGAIVNIEAVVPPAGMLFDHWSGDTGTVVNVDAASTTLRMPSADATVTAVFRAASSVGDGIPDDWRASNFGGNGSVVTERSAASADPDGDGQNNLEEFNAGTNPNDSSSVFKLDIVQADGVNFGAEFSTRPSYRYVIERSDVLAPDSWEPFSHVMIGDGQPIEFFYEIGDEPLGFFRVESTADPAETPEGLAGE